MTKRPSQKDLVAAVHIGDGRIRVLDAIYHLTDPDGTVHRVTRLAAIIWTLRRKEGWDIETVNETERTPAGDQKVATYILKAAPHAGVPTVVPPRAFENVNADPSTNYISVNPPHVFGEAGPETAAVAPERTDPLRPGATAPVRGPDCPTEGCNHTLVDVTSIAPGFATGRCPKHGRKTVRL